MLNYTDLLGKSLAHKAKFKN